MIKVHCDGPRCEKTCYPDSSSPGWIEATTKAVNRLSGEDRVRHYCSYKCEHAHTYLLISSDNGK